MLVIASPGTRCPMERKPRAYITASAPVEVPSTAYYRRLLADGSLRAYEPPAPVAPAKKRKELTDGQQ